MEVAFYMPPRMVWVSDGLQDVLCGSFYVDDSNEKFDGFEDVTW